jgi:antirestriction protein
MTISNTDDVIDSRDVIARIEELEGERGALVSDLEEADETNIIESEHAAKIAITAWDEENEAELKALEALAEEAEGYAPDWRYGAALVRDSYFEDYARELLEDCGDIPRNLPHYIEIDWEATARNIRADYTEVDFDGVSYWVR